MQIGNRDFAIGKRTYVMGILNATPDSFSDGGKWDDVESAKKQVKKMIDDGADIIDVGGESTRPGYSQIREEEEIKRVVPIIEMIKQDFQIPVSVDTYKSAVAEAALQAGADMLNDIWGFRYDENMATVAARYEVPVCLMHNRHSTDSSNFLDEVWRDMERSLSVAEKHGVKSEKIILDPGIGFGKTYEQNLYMMKHLDEFCQKGYPVLLGTSRKSMIGRALDLPIEERVEGTLATSVIGAMKGCSFVRVHDVKENVRALRMAETIWSASLI